MGFVFICGANDGGALLALGIRHRGASATLVLGLLAAAVATGPALFGLGVAATFTGKLVDAGTPPGRLVFLGGTTVAMAVVLTLTWRGIPTSITLALLGAISGAALGFGAAPDWGRLGFVLGLGAAAPLVGLVLANGLGRLVRWLPIGRTGRWTGTLQLAAFAGQSLAYAANDGQKMYAVVVVAAGAAGHGLELGGQVWPALTIAGVFAVGAAVSLRRVGRGASTTLLRMRPGHVISAEVASSVAVFGSAVLGAPVSMTQATTGGLVGAALNDGPRSVRWQYSVPLLVAWVVTLPAALAGGVLIGLILNGVAG
ncbi:phosphate transporter [Kribbella flavida DSM 17836]|uniref:Phosphate transporter n=1 Tax=Kribbella flavida (strain DSM 17836 / JCM 10339 / NBRC 14399) TaxID=479435 RepID=D2PPX7_KRIFD|nr:inorganic phosphate transporter [Kribbella flavida]ADB32901.1 phosphate transporter [Kribbella flavida DSM 17836]